MKYCCQLAPAELTPIETEELPLISEAVEIIECYHVLLLQRPPYLLPTLLARRPENTLRVDLAPLFDFSPQGEGVTGSIREVANLGVYAWASIPRERATTEMAIVATRVYRTWSGTMAEREEVVSDTFGPTFNASLPLKPSSASRQFELASAICAQIHQSPRNGE